MHPVVLFQARHVDLRYLSAALRCCSGMIMPRMIKMTYINPDAKIVFIFYPCKKIDDFFSVV